MIKILTDNESASALTSDELIGKYVLVDAGFHWFALNKPRVVTSISGGRVNLDSVERTTDPDSKLELVTGRGQGKSAGYILKQSIRGVCDTHEEVNLLLKEAKKSSVAYLKLLKDIKGRVMLLNGKSMPEIPEMFSGNDFSAKGFSVSSEWLENEIKSGEENDAGLAI